MHFSQVFIRSISFTPNINDSDVAILGVSRSQKQLPFTDGLVAELRKCGSACCPRRIGCGIALLSSGPLHCNPRDRILLERHLQLAPFGIQPSVGIGCRHAETGTPDRAGWRVAHEFISDEWINVCILKCGGEKMSQSLRRGEFWQAEFLGQTHELEADAVGLDDPKLRPKLPRESRSFPA